MMKQLREQHGLQNVDSNQDDFSNKSERMKEIEKKRDIEFEKHLRIFYKNMIERLNN